MRRIALLALVVCLAGASQASAQVPAIPGLPPIVKQFIPPQLLPQAILKNVNIPAIPTKAQQFIPPVAKKFLPQNGQLQIKPLGKLPLPRNLPTVRRLLSRR